MPRLEENPILVEFPSPHPHLLRPSSLVCAVTGHRHCTGAQAAQTLQNVGCVSALSHRLIMAVSQIIIF